MIAVIQSCKPTYEDSLRQGRLTPVFLTSLRNFAHSFLWALQKSRQRQAEVVLQRHAELIESAGAHRLTVHTAFAARAETSHD